MDEIGQHSDVLHNALPDGLENFRQGILKTIRTMCVLFSVKSLHFQSAFKMYELKFLRRFRNLPQCRYCLLKIIARRTLKK